MSLVRLVSSLLRGRVLREIPCRRNSWVRNLRSKYEEAIEPRHLYKRSSKPIRHLLIFKMQDQVAFVVSFSMFYWIFWHLYFEWEHVAGGEQDETLLSWKDYTDEELGIPPDDMDIYPDNYIPAAELAK